MAKNIPEDRLSLEEILAIYLYDTYYTGLNSTLGGEATRGYKHTEASKQKMRKPKSKETKKKISKANKGKTFGIKRSLLSNARRKYLSDINKGKKLSNKTKEKMSKSRMGHISYTLGIKQSEETINKRVAKIAKTYKIIKPDGTTEIIKNLRKYCEANNLSTTSMSKVAKGRRKSHKKYICKYFISNENL